MTSLTFASPEFWNWFEILPWRRRKSRSEESKTARDDARARRDFIDDMLTRSPDAFTSELDVQSMMHLYPGRF